MQDTVLTDRDIRKRLQHSPPLVVGLLDEATQVQSCGVDLTLRTVSRFLSAGCLDFDNTRRSLADREEIPWLNDAMDLPPGAYHIIYNEQVNLPPDIMALAYPRSSLLRCGVTTHTAVWDPGYSGRAESLMLVHNPHGFRLDRRARVTQLVFTQLGNGVENVYQGRYNHEHV